MPQTKTMDKEGIEASASFKPISRTSFPAWRGTPQLFAHVVRVLCSSISDNQSQLISLSIDIEVRDDHEHFTSADDFLQNVTIEALRSFRSIEVVSSSKLGTACLSLRWVHPWWSWTKEDNCIVELEVTGSDSAWAENVQHTILVALNRGTLRVKENVLAYLAGTCLGLVTVSTIIVTLYLFPSESVRWLIIIAGIILFLAAVYFTAWVIPSIEIASKGGTRLWRTAKAVGPVLIAIAIAGLTKKLFGS
jgi:hypothetical protein